MMKNFDDSQPLKLGFTLSALAFFFDFLLAVGIGSVLFLPVDFFLLRPLQNKIFHHQMDIYGRHQGGSFVVDGSAFEKAVPLILLIYAAAGIVILWLVFLFYFGRFQTHTPFRRLVSHLFKKES